MATNHVLNASFERDLAGTWDSSGPGTLDRAQTADVPHGDWFARLTGTSTGNPSVETDSAAYIPVNEGETWTLSASFRWGSGTEKPVHLDLRWRDADGVSFQAQIGGSFTPADTAWLRIPNNNNVAPAGAAFLSIRVVCVGMELGDELRIDGVMAEQGDVDPPSPWVPGPDEPVVEPPTSTGIMLGNLVDEVLATLEGYGLNQGRSAFLAEPIEPETMKFVVNNTDNLAEGLAEIGDETIYIQSLDRQSNEVTVSPDGRGYRGTTPGEHSQDSRLTMNPIFPRGMVRRKINETITGTWPDLWGESSTELDWSPIIASYEMPTEAEDITSVQYEALGATKEWPYIRHWRLDRHADPTDFSTGVSLTIRDSRLWYTSRRVRVGYRHAPLELAESNSLLSDSGLATSARAVITWGAAWRLVAFMDPSRLGVNTAASDQVDEQKPVGTGVQVASYLRKAYEQELADERRRQELRTPPISHFTESYL